MRYNTDMNINKIPTHGSYKRNEFDQYEWERDGENVIKMVKIAECENPQYEAYIVFPDGIMDFSQMDTWNISVGYSNSNGGECDLDDDYIDQFDALFDHFVLEYGTKDQKQTA